MVRSYLLFLAVVLFATSCSSVTSERASNTRPAATPIQAASSTPPTAPESTPEETAGKSATLACQTVNAGEYDIYKKQTFAIDFEPFRNSCFVTSHNPEYDDPPMESRFAIFKNGKNVFDFPSQFNGVNFGCWIDAVAFQDLNNDKRTDVIVVSKCQAKSSEYNENTVYINDGKGFTTREDANTQLGEFTTVRQVVDFVKENGSMFF